MRARHATQRFTSVMMERVSRRLAMRLAKRRSFAVAVLVLSACASGPSAAPAPAPVPAPVPSPTPPAPVPAATPAPRTARYRLPLVLQSTSYAVRLRADLERDSAGRKERSTVESSARVELTLRRDTRGALRGIGRVDSFTVRASGSAVRNPSAATTSPATPDVPAFTNVVLDAVLDSTQVRAVVRPALANECDRAEAAAADMARDLLVRVPESLSVGDRWRDSLVTLVCRSGVPITLRTIIESTFEGTTDNDRTLRIRRVLTVRMEGSNRMPWRQAEVNGDGQGTQELLIDVATGVLLSLEGESTSTIRVTNGAMRDQARVQQVQQKVTLSARRLTP